MSTPKFTHLHLHTQYSLLQGAIRVESLFDRVKELGMDAVAMTDSHNLFGAIDFYKSAKEVGVKPIIGCEVFYAPHGLHSAGVNLGKSRTGAGGSSSGVQIHHLVLLCKNISGYRNLCTMITESYQRVQRGTKGVVDRAVVDRVLLDRYGNDLIVLSGCLRGEINSQLLTGEETLALEAAQWYRKRFGEDFFFELQDSGLPENDQCNQILSTWGNKYGIGCVATVDCHYLKPEDAEAHEVLQCIEHGKNLDFDRPKSLVPPEFYLKSAEEVYARFERYPGVVENSTLISERCNLEFSFKDEKGKPIYHLPQFRPEAAVPEEAEVKQFDLNAYFREDAWKGLRARFEEPGFSKKRAISGWDEKQKLYEARLESELTMIGRTGFAGYFLIVADFINWAKRKGIPVGPGRGSGAGSLVAFSLKITDIDPIEFNLLFERFINPERISMPDFDVDFCQDRRGEVIQYVAQRYGASNVCQIITFGKLQARAVIKDVARVLGLSFAESDVLTKLIPDGLDMTVDKALELEPKLQERMESDPRVHKLISYAKSLEGLYRTAGLHAAGVIITEKPVVSYCPLFVGKEGVTVSQFDKDFCEAIGLVKFDFLGLKTLTVIANAIELVHAGEGGIKGDSSSASAPDSARDSARDSALDFSLDHMNYDDPKVFALISSGDTDGVFQVESSGMKDLCSRIQPSSLEDLTAINALYRPGPLGSGMVDDFIDRKHGRKPIVYDVEMLAPILKDTYGVILYQEQVMQIARDLAGYSLGQADLLRRAMGKKKPEEMAKHREIFVTGCVKRTENPISTEKAEAIFDLMAKFAEYGFNKSHSAAYGVLTYQTAYLKAHYPAEFMAALMTTEMDKTDKITKYISDARTHQIPILPPDVNYSQRRFSVESVPAGSKYYPKKELGNLPVKGIRFGLEAIKGVGGIAVDAVLEARIDTSASGGKFRNVLDFCKRVPTRKVNKKVTESLVLAGAFDTIAEVNRASLFASIEPILEHAGDEQAERELGQSSLFDSFSAEQIKLVTPTSGLFKTESDWPASKKLAQEKQIMGVYVSGHPMDPWQSICEEWLGSNTEKIKERCAAAKKAPEKSQNQNQNQNNDDFSRNYKGGYRGAPKPEVKLAGLIGEVKEITTKKGTRMAFAQLEDIKGKVELVFFSDVYLNLQELIKRAANEAEPVVLGGELEAGEETAKILVKTMELVTEAYKAGKGGAQARQMIIKLQPNKCKPEQLRELKNSLLQFRGKSPVRIDFVDPEFKTFIVLPKEMNVDASPMLVTAINRIFGTAVIFLQ